MFAFDVQPAVISELPVQLSVELHTEQDGLDWCITALNPTNQAIAGDVQVEWRLPESARDRILVFSTELAVIPRAFVIDFQPMNRPESFVHLWLGERFTVDLAPGEWVQLIGSVEGSPDIDQDGAITAKDVAGVLSAWGEPCCEADVNCNGLVEAQDLVLVLGALSGE